MNIINKCVHSSIEKVVEYMNNHFKEKKIWMHSKHMRLYSISLIVKKIQIEVKIGYIYLSVLKKYKYL